MPNINFIALNKTPATAGFPSLTIGPYADVGVEAVYVKQKESQNVDKLSDRRIRHVSCYGVMTQTMEQHADEKEEKRRANAESGGNDEVRAIEAERLIECT